MNYEIIGEPTPALVCTLDRNEKMVTQSGAMAWIKGNVRMETGAGGIGKAIGRIFSGESAFRSTYTAEEDGALISFASSLPGNIRAFDLSSGKTIIAQKTAFLASTDGVDTSVFFQKKFGVGLFGGEGFIMQKISGCGTVFLEIDGSAVEYDLAPGEKLTVSSGNLAMMDETCSIDVVRIHGVKNILFGGEGLFLTEITGPGKVTLQTMPISRLAEQISKYIPKENVTVSTGSDD